MRAGRIAILAIGLVLGGRAAIAQTIDAPTPTPLPSPSVVSAGTIPANVSLDVTGSPADGTFLETQIRKALSRVIKPTLRPGAGVSYGPIVPWPLLPLARGTRTAVNVTIRIAGDAGTAPVTGITTVTIDNTADVPPAPPPVVLFLSDDPEYLLSEGLVFRGTVTTQRPARLYYYHSDIGVPRDLDVVLTTSAASRVQLTEAAAGPDLDVMNAGHIVSRDFLRYQHYGETVMVDLVPGRPFVVRHALLLQGEVAAGAVDAHVMNGAPVNVSVVSSAAGGSPDAYLAGPRVPYDGHRRHGTFALAGYGNITSSYSVGGSEATVRYGDKTPSPRNLDPNDDGRDYGDYGVLQHITFTLANPTDDPRLVYLYQKPLGGPVRASFLVDGQFKELGCVRMPQPYWIATYQLAPHSTGVTTTVTMPDGGSFYPVQFGVTEAQPLPYTPPVGSPDGCSPIAARPGIPTASLLRSSSSP